MTITWRGLSIQLLDVLAVLWFFLGWLGYARFAHWRAGHIPSLLSMMQYYRRNWWVRIIERELRMIDTSILANLSNTSTFFASTTLLILGGLLAVLGSTEKLMALIQGLPFQARTSSELWEVKIGLLIGIFVYGFFKFTWSLRQYAMAAVLVGAAPKVPREAEDEASFIDGATRITHQAAEHFNFGLRAYYFGLAALAWFLNAWFFMAATTWVVFVLYWREFRSQALAAITPQPRTGR
jgi:uncharacterized membrane protein